MRLTTLPGAEGRTGWRRGENVVKFKLFMFFRDSKFPNNMKLNM